MNPTYTNYSTINEDFDFGRLEIESVDMDTLETGVSEAMAPRNLEIPLDQLLAGAFKLKLTNTMTQELTFGKYLGWQHPKNKKPVVDRLNSTCKNAIETMKNRMKNPNMWVSHSAKEEPCTVKTISANIISQFNSTVNKDLVRSKFKLIASTNLTNSYDQPMPSDCLMNAADIDDHVCNCINATIKYVTGRDYDFRYTLFMNIKKAPKTETTLVYKIWVSPDNGVIIIDHISEYNSENLKINLYNSGGYEVLDYPNSILMGAVIFTNSKGYVLNYNKKESKQQLSQVENTKKELKFIYAMEQILNITCKRVETYAWSSKVRGIEAFEVRHDPHGHIWYPCVPLNAYADRHYNMPAPKTFVVPDDMSKLKRLYSFYAFSPVIMSSKQWVQCVSHPKIRGYRHIEMPGAVIYQTNDPEFCQKLLGPGSATYLRQFADMYYEDKKINNWVCLYSFIWFDDWAMEIYDKFIDDPKSSASSLNRFLKQVKQVSHGNFIRAQVEGKL